jgi:hypothetical protein
LRGHLTSFDGSVLSILLGSSLESTRNQAGIGCSVGGLATTVVIVVIVVTAVVVIVVIVTAVVIVVAIALSLVGTGRISRRGSRARRARARARALALGSLVRGPLISLVPTVAVVSFLGVSIIF